MSPHDEATMIAVVKLVFLFLASLVAAIKLDEVTYSRKRKLMNKIVMKGSTSGHGKFSFAVLGDGPYSDDTIPYWVNIISDVNSRSDIDFVIHVGDCKSGDGECTDERLIGRSHLYQSFSKPFIYSMGANEWTDCRRASHGLYNPLERLAFVRKLFFPFPNQTIGGAVMPVTAQPLVMPEFAENVENVLFIKGNVVFSTLNIPGSNNDLRPWSDFDPNDSYNSSPRSDRIAEGEERANATLAWIDYTFETADANNNNMAIFFAIQADMGSNLNCFDRSRLSFIPILERLLPMAKKFKKFVVLGHGDNHYFLLDNSRFVPFEVNLDPISHADNIQIPYFIYVQGFGDSNFAGLVASTMLWFRRLFLFGFDTPTKLWAVVYESFVVGFLWGLTYLFVRRGMNPDTRRNFFQQFWKDALYGGLAAFYAIFLQAILNNLNSQEALKVVLRDRLLKLNHWIKITVDPTDPLIFKFESQLVVANLLVASSKLLPWGSATPVY